MKVDLVIRGGQLVDGTGAAARSADVAVHEGRIVEVGEVASRGTREVDATDLVVAPGFIDPHTHYDAQLCWDPWATSSSWHGVTTVVVGNCGFGIAPCKPEHRDQLMRMLVRVEGMAFESLSAGIAWDFESFPDYGQMLERRGLGLNVATLVPHSALRLAVMGEAAWEREANAVELQAMVTQLERAVTAGAVGLSSSNHASHIGHSGAPVPSRRASEDELETLSTVLARLKVGTLQLARETAVPPATVDALGAWARRLGRPITFGSIRQDPGNPQRHGLSLARVAAWRSEGVALHPQVSAASLSMEFRLPDSTVMYRLPSWAPLLKRPPATWAQTLRSPAFQDTIRQELSAAGRLALFEDEVQALTLQAAHSADLQGFVGRGIQELARELHCSPLAAFFELSIRDDYRAEFSACLMNTDPAAVEQILTDPHVLLSLSDAGAHANLMCEAGQTSRLLGHWVRERKALSLEAAVRKITAEPAAVFGLKGRGLINAGYAGDLVVFDPQTINAAPQQLVHDMPGGASRFVQRAEGIHHAFIAGVPMLEQGQLTDTRAGRWVGHQA